MGCFLNSVLGASIDWRWRAHAGAHFLSLRDQARSLPKDMKMSQVSLETATSGWDQAAYSNTILLFFLCRSSHTMILQRLLCMHYVLRQGTAPRAARLFNTKIQACHTAVCQTWVPTAGSHATGLQNAFQRTGQLCDTAQRRRQQKGLHKAFHLESFGFKSASRQMVSLQGGTGGFSGDSGGSLHLGWSGCCFFHLLAPTAGLLNVYGPSQSMSTAATLFSRGG